MQRISNIAGVFCLMSLCGVTSSEVAAQSITSRSLAGWSSANPHYWSVAKNTIVGHAPTDVPRNEFLWSEEEVSDFYLSIDVLLDPNDRNAGIQFRSKKADSTGQAVGYQADIGRDVWGRLYHEHDRGKLDWSDRGEKAVKPGKWNHYEILAVGDRIWTAINGKIAVAVKDPDGEKKGYIALQIHSGPPQTVRYKIKKLVHNPPVKLAGLNEQALNRELKTPLAGVSQKQQSPALLQNHKVFALAGGTNIAGMRKDGYLETLLYAATADGEFRVWNLGWDGDTVFEQFRDVGFGGWDKNLDSLGVEVLLLQFGQAEVLGGNAALPAFTAAYRAKVQKAQKEGRKVILLSPIPFEPDRLFTVEDMPNPLVKVDMQAYAQAVGALAGELGCDYIDLHSVLLGHPAFGSLTSDGMHLNAEGQKVVAGIIASQLLGTELVYSPKLEAIRREVVEKNHLWTSYWRPGNWAFLYGDRTTQPFSHDWQDRTKRIFPEEVRRFEPMILEAERKINDQKKRAGLASGLSK